MAEIRDKLIEAGSFVKEKIEHLIFEVRHESEEIVRTGAGIPRAFTSLLNLSYTVTATVGASAVALDFMGKIYGPRECHGCNGWEGVACQTCRGLGVTQFTPPKRSSEGAMAAGDIASGRVRVAEEPLMGSGFRQQLPTKNCGTCNGSGVMKCRVCNGHAWKNKFTLDRILDPSVKAWQVYSLSSPAPAPALSLNPEVARFELLVKPELESGQKLPTIVKEALWSGYEKHRQYEILRRKVADKEEGWEKAQEEMVRLNPERATNDPVYVPNIPFYYALKEAERKVLNEEPPKRPPHWKGSGVEVIPTPGSYSVDDLTKKSFWDDLMARQKVDEERYLDLEWATFWRKERAKELLARKIVGVEDVGFVSKSNSKSNVESNKSLVKKRLKVRSK